MIAKEPPVWTSASDVRASMRLLDKIEDALAESSGDVYIAAGSRLILWNANDYPIGFLTYEEDQWKFTAWDERENG